MARNKLSFISEERKNTRRKHTAAAAAAVFLFVLISVFIFHAFRNDWDIARLLGARGTTAPATTEEPLTTTAPTTDEDHFGLLFVCADSSDEFSFSYVLDIYPTLHTLRITALGGDRILTTEGEITKLSDFFASSGIKALFDVLRIKNNLDLDRYVFITERNFRNLVNSFDSVIVDVPFTYQIHDGDSTVTVRSGANRMSSVSFLRYIKYAGTGTDLLKNQSDAHTAAFEQHFEEFVEGGTENFDLFLNLTSGNLSALDFVNLEGLFAEFFSETPVYEAY